MCLLLSPQATQSPQRGDTPQSSGTRRILLAALHANDRLHQPHVQGLHVPTSSSLHYPTSSLLGPGQLGLSCSLTTDKQLPGEPVRHAGPQPWVVGAEMTKLERTLTLP